MTTWSWERFWEAMESLSVLWFGLAVADVLFGLLAVVSLASMPIDRTDPAFVVAVLDLVIVVVTLVPLAYVLYRLRERERGEW